jgi:acyl-CoA synthetase (AMP-forming)/AMP-acid ligase II
MKEPATLVDALLHPLRPDHRIGVLTGNEPVFTTYVELLERSTRVLGHLQQRGVQPGSFVGFYIGDVQAFLELFWACLLGGAVPVPVSVGASDEHTRKVLRVLGLFERPYLVTDPASWTRIAAHQEAAGPAAELESRLVWVEDLARAAASGPAGDHHSVQPDDLAYVQFSSGSTRLPKGIQLTHRNLVANTLGIIEAIQLEPEDRPHAWMPLTHDMGLIGGHLTPFMRGTNHTLIPTERFVRRPLTWLLEAAAHGVTVTSGPNFAYQHVLRAYKPERFEGVDLSAVRVIFNGAEPISYDLVKRFLDVFRAHRLNPASMFPVYGLAEASLAVTMPPLLSGLRRTSVDRAHLGAGETVRPPTGDGGGLDLVPCGRPIRHTEVVVGDGSGRPVAAPDGTVGPIWIRGTNVTSRIRTEDGDVDPLVEGWYDTGDLGFVHEGELHVAGRIKEMAIVNGQNIYPHDVEMAAATVDGVEIGKVAAAGVREAEREVLGIFVQWRKSAETFEPLAQQVREAVTKQTGFAATLVVPVPQIPKTTSGKLQRIRLAEEYERGQQ